MARKIIIESRTHTKPINAKGEIFTPNAVQWYVKNTGNTNIYLNGERMKPGDFKGVDNSIFLATLVAAGIDADVRDKTVCNVTFNKTDISDTTADRGDGTFGGRPTPLAVLVTTEYFMKQI